MEPFTFARSSDLNLLVSVKMFVAANTFCQAGFCWLHGQQQFGWLSKAHSIFDIIKTPWFETQRIKPEV